ncbi:MAG: RNA-directed DNA polymerase, partial [Candidatus Schekmanbacteria bacterium]|nr:RNA-directed DNA polymerase [Candidatus Schekmanbacteria bacterium]
MLRGDIRKYFPSIDWEILLARLARHVRDPGLPWLSRVIVESSNPQEPALFYFPGDDLFTPHVRRRGIPIGNQTSQFFANAYLDPLDHFVKD